MPNSLSDFLKLESAGGIVLVLAACVALLLANSPLSGYYHMLLDMPVEIRVGPLQVAKPLLLWINDGMMAIFFFLVGLELKREVLEGELSDWRTTLFPALGAIGGMACPAALYAWLNWGDEMAIKGWAIPTATDIAFALGILSLLGRRVPTSLKIFLVSLAIFDDVGAILIIALFYTSHLSLAALSVVVPCLLALLVLNRRQTTELVPYLLVGVVMWVAVLKSGVHATLAGVLLALFIPLRTASQPQHSPLKALEHDLHPAVTFVILPLFAFANSGIALAGIGIDQLLHPVPLGIAAGLFLGKQLGVFTVCWLGVKLKIAALPRGMNWAHLYGVALLCGVGFTMSLFIGSLAFAQTSLHPLFDERLGILGGSLLSALAGYLVLHRSLPPASEQRAE